METQKEKKSELKWILSGMVIIAVLILIIVLLVSYVKKISKPSKQNIKTSIITMLQNTLEIGELSTVQYTYNAVVQVTDEEEGTAKYSVAYEGVVKAGINSFESLIHSLEIDEEKKEIHITIPEVEILDCIVDAGSLDYIFAQEKDNTATLPQEAYKICKADLENRAEGETELLSLARENAKSTVSALLEPYEQIYGYKIKVYKSIGE